MSFARHTARCAQPFLVRLSLVLAVTLGACGGTDPGPTAPPGEYVPGELLTQLQPDLPDSLIARRLTEQGLSLVRVTGVEPRYGLVRVPVGGEEYWAAALVQQGLILAAERNAIVLVSSTRRSVVGCGVRFPAT